jgi:hypothetical protein
MNEPVEPPVDGVTAPVPGSQCRLQRGHVQRVEPQSVGMEPAVRHPTMRRIDASDTKAVKAIPDHVGTLEKWLFQVEDVAAV